MKNYNKVLGLLIVDISGDQKKGMLFVVIPTPYASFWPKVD